MCCRGAADAEEERKTKNFFISIKESEKIFRNRQRRIKESHNGKRKSNCQENDFLGSDYISVINLLDRKKFAVRYRLLKQQERISIPEIFSISENAEQVIKLLRETYTVLRCERTRKIIFDHTACLELGLSASTIMDIIVLAAGKYREEQGECLDIEGHLPHNKSVRDILLASGLPYHLKAESLSRFDEEHVQRFETIRGRHDIRANKADEVSTKLVLYFNKCLKTQNLELNEEGLRLLSRILGEVISNCEIHGGESATWYTQGHYQIKDDNSFGEMQMLFLNLGETIYEGLKDDVSKETKNKVRHILKRQAGNMHPDWDEEMVLTVFALQEGISRLRDSNIEGYEGRGSGTVSMIEMFNDIGKCERGLKPQMTIISGKTQIKFTDTYKMKRVRFERDAAFGTGDKRIIAFNKENYIYAPPDRNNVIKMSEYFPGTVISLKFYLDNRYITSKKRR